MTNFTAKLYVFAFHVLKYISLLFSFFLLLSGLMFTSTDLDITTLATTITADNLILNILMLLVFLSGFFLVKIFCKKNGNLTVRILMATTFLFYTVFGILLILFAKSVPHTDSLFVYEISVDCAHNNLEAINPSGYLSVYPHQTGLVFFYEILIRFLEFLGIQGKLYMWLQAFNLLLTLLMIYALYKIVSKLFHSAYISACYFLLVLFCFPTLFFILRVYGDIPSISLFTVCIWTFIELLDEKSFKASNRKKRYVFLMLTGTLCLAVSVATRKNIIICIIALTIVIFLTAIYQKRFSLIILLLCYGLVTTVTLPVITYTYETRAHNQLDEGTPALAYIAMGMQNSPRANGWYNAFNYNIYVESNHDLAFAKMYSKKKIDEKLTYFKNNPREAYDFYIEKYLSQWCDGTYASRELTANTNFERNTFFKNFYGENGGKIYIFFCNQFQNLLYLGTFIFCFMSLFSKKLKSPDLPCYIGILASFGGFLFHLLWEANVRAIFPYMLLLIPSGAAGIKLLLDFIPHKIKK